MNYHGIFEPAEEGGFVVTFPDFGWGATQGETEEEAMEMAQDALAMIIADYIEKGLPVPEPARHKGKKVRVVPLPALPAAKLELHKAFLESGIRKAELARRIKTSKGNIDRLFDLHHSTRIEVLEEAFTALGKRLTVSAVAA